MRPLYRYVPERLRIPVLFTGWVMAVYYWRSILFCGPPRDENNVRIPITDPEFVDAWTEYHYRMNMHTFHWGTTGGLLLAFHFVL